MIKPMGDKVLILVDDKEETTAAGIILAEDSQEDSERGEVVAVGPESVLAPGARVLFTKYGGSDIKHEGVEYLLVPESTVLAVE